MIDPDHDEELFAATAIAAAAEGSVLLTEDQAALLFAHRGKTIARVKCGTPPGNLTTIAQLEEWFASERQRMQRDLEAQTTAHFERVMTSPSEH